MDERNSYSEYEGDYMSTQDNMEKILRSLHVLLSKSEPYPKEPSKVIVDKQLMLDLLNELNKSIYDIMDEYELTKQSRDRAEREFRKKADEIVENANRKAEDTYAASVLYTDEALTHIQEIMKEAAASAETIYKDINKKLKEQQRLIKLNQIELKSQLQDFRDTEKYVKLIEERNRELKKQKESDDSEEYETPIYTNRQTAIKINQQHLEKLGISLEEELPVEEKKAEVEVDIKIDFDSDYFSRKREQEQESKPKVSQEKVDRFQSILKGITSGKK